MLGLHVGWTYSEIDLKELRRGLDRRCRQELMFLIGQLGFFEG